MIDILQFPQFKRPLPHKFTATVGGKSHTVVIWGEPGILDEFLKDATAGFRETISPKQVSVKGHTRRAFPGDNGHTVKGHSRTFAQGGTIEGTNATPGRPFQLRKGIVVAGKLEFATTRQFTLAEGTSWDLRKIVEAKRRTRMLLILPSSARVIFNTDVGL